MQANNPNDQALPEKLWTRGFTVILAIAFLTYANISVFFEFFAYLKTCPIDPSWFGTLMGVFAGVSLLVRPLVIPFFQPGNARSFLVLGTVLAILALGSYSLTQSLPGLMGVRIFHGLAFVVMGAALTALMMPYVPKGGSARFFGIISIVVLIPNTLVPPLLPFLTRVLGGLPGVLLGFAGLTALIFLLLPLVPKNAAAGTLNKTQHLKLSRKEILANLTDPKVVLLLLAMLCLYCGHALVFFFLDGFSRELAIPNAGLFLTLSTLGEIGVRVCAGKAMDRAPKDRLLILTLIGLTLSFLLLGSLGFLPPGFRLPLFYALGALAGLGWGVAMPVFNGLMFDISNPRLQSFNTNLGFQMFQAGFFLGPFLGSALAGPAGFGPVFYLAALLSLAGVFMMGMFKKRNI